MEIEIYDKIKNESDIIHIPKECLKYNTLREDIENYIKSTVYDDWSDKKLYPEDETFQKFFIEIDKKGLFKKKLIQNYYKIPDFNPDDDLHIGFQKIYYSENLELLLDFIEFMDYNIEIISDLSDLYLEKNNYEIFVFLFDMLISLKPTNSFNCSALLTYSNYSPESPTQKDLKNYVKILKYHFDNIDKINYHFIDEPTEIDKKEILDLLYEYKEKLNISVEHINGDMYKITPLK